MIEKSDWIQTIRVTSPGGALTVDKLRDFLSEVQAAGISDDTVVTVRGSNETEIVLYATEEVSTVPKAWRAA